jgi:NTE family protein
MPRYFLEDQLIERNRLCFKGKIALVFSGGGARGGYQIGCWKALEDSKIKIDGAYGTSVGSMNAAAVAQGDLDLAIETWKEMDYSAVMVVTPEIKHILDMVEKGLGLREVFRALKMALEGKGIDTEPLRRTLNSLVCEEKIRGSGIDVGLVTYSLSEMKPLLLYLDEIPEGKLVDYILASANYPVFKRAELDRKRFIDGGIYMNIPVQMPKNRGFEDVILVDIGTRSLIDRWNLITSSFEESRTLYIRPRVHFGGPMQFSKTISRQYMVEGYLDTMTALGIFKGKYTYVFETIDVLPLLLQGLSEEDFAEALSIIGVKASQTESPMYFYFRQLLPVLEEGLGVEGSRDCFAALADLFFEVFEFERFELYTGRDFFEMNSQEAAGDQRLYGIMINDILLSDLLRMLSFVYEKSRNSFDRPGDYRLYRASLESLGKPRAQSSEHS